MPEPTKQTHALTCDVCMASVEVTGYDDATCATCGTLYTYDEGYRIEPSEEQLLAMRQPGPKDSRVERTVHGVLAGLFDRLTRPSLPIRLLQDRINSLESRCEHLQDLLTQAYERAGIVAVQPEHKGPPAPPVKQRMTWGEIDAENQRRHAEDYRIWLEGEAKRKAHVAQVKAN